MQSIRCAWLSLVVLVSCSQGAAPQARTGDDAASDDAAVVDGGPIDAPPESGGDAGRGCTATTTDGGAPSRQVLPSQSVHQYSAISPVSVGGGKLHMFDLQGNASIVRLSDGSSIAAKAPYPEAHWDNTDDDLLWTIGRNRDALIETWRPSTGVYRTEIDYSSRFSSITTGSTTDITYDDWEAFWAETDHTVCAVDLAAKKTYCIDYDLPDPVNHVGATSNIDYVAVTPRDSRSGLHYVILMAAQPAAAIFSVDEAAGTLRWVTRPEDVAPGMGNRPTQNNDGNCDPGEACMTTPHADVLTAPDGQVYLVNTVGIEGDLAGNGQHVCEEGEALMRLNSGVKMSTLERLGGGMKYVTDYSCGTNWSGTHIGCNRNGGHCVISFSSPPPMGMLTTPKKEDIWLIGLDCSGAVTYSKIGNSGSSTADYWATPRGALSMDGTRCIYDSDMGTSGAQHAVFELGTGLSGTAPP
jgi:hypothetical protein